MVTVLKLIVILIGSLCFNFNLAYANESLMLKYDHGYSDGLTTVSLKKFDVDLGKAYFVQRAKLIYRKVEILNHIYETAKRFDMDPFLLLSLIKRESDFDPNSLSAKNAVGMMQITQYPVEEYEAVYGKVKDFVEPKLNITIGTFYLRRLIDSYEDLHVALIHYQGGPRYFNILKKKNRLTTPYTREIVEFAMKMKYS